MPEKIGLDYFSLCCTLDDKFELIEAEFGLTGFAVVIKLFQRIYGEHGYYCKWTKEVAMVFAMRNGTGANVVSEIVSASVKRGLFDKTLYDKYGILTSEGIQKRYFKAVSRRKSVELISRYLLVDYTLFLKDVDISLKDVDICGEDVDISKQSRVEKSKVKDKKNNNKTTDSVSLSHARETAPEKRTGIPSIGECDDYFWKLMDDPYYDKNLPAEVDPSIESFRFHEYNEARGWDRAYEWKHLAEQWLKQLIPRTGGG